MSERLLAGVARQVISPPVGVYLIGYGDRAKGNVGIHDDLTATALVLQDGEHGIAVVTCDLLCLNEYIVDRIRAALAPIQPIIFCSHTHSGPIAYADERSSRAERAYIESLVRCIIQAVEEAARQAVPVTVSLAHSQASIAVNRREHTPEGEVVIGEDPAGAVDPSLAVVSLLKESGERMATLVNYACHGTVLGPDNLLVSADWVGAMRAAVESELGGMALFLQGATGNLNPKMGWGNAHVWEMVDSQGRAVAEAVVAAARGNGEALAGLPLRLRRAEVPLPFEAAVASDKPPTGYRKRILSMAGLPAFLWPLTDILLNKRYPWRSRLLPGAGDLDGLWTTPLRINALRIGDLALVAFGSETFTEIGLQVKKSLPQRSEQRRCSLRHTLFASVSDGCIGYLTTAEAHAEGGYEVDLAPYAYRFPGRMHVRCAEIALRATGQLLSELWEAS